MQDWTAASIKRVFMIADAPAHGYYDRDDYPNGTPDAPDMRELMREFQKKEIEFTFIQLNKDCDKMVEAMKESHMGFELKMMIDQQEKINQIWAKYDTDGSGDLDYDEARNFAIDSMKETGEQFSDQGFDVLFTSMDTDGSGTIEKSEMIEFINKMMEVCAKPGNSARKINVTDDDFISHAVSVSLNQITLKRNQ